MNYRLSYSDQFWEDFASALRYTVMELKNPIAANALNDALNSAVQTVAAFPNAMPAWRGAGSRETVYRSVSVKSYLAFYVVTGDTVEFRRFLSGASDLSTQLTED